MATAMFRGQLDAMAANLLPLMDDPKAWDEPLPPCTAQAHEWSIAHDRTFHWQDSIASGSATFKVAIVCAHCTAHVGFS